jgi:hypothetical protein
MGDFRDVLGGKGAALAGALLAFALLAGPAGAQYCAATGPVNLGFDPLSGSIPKDCNCSCTGTDRMTGFRCYPPVLGGPSYELRPAGCNPKTQACTVRATLEVDFPGNSQGLMTPGSGAYLDWSGASSSAGSCGYPGGNEIFTDKGSAWIEVGGFTCSGGASAAGSYSLLAQVCVAGCQPAAELRRGGPLGDSAQRAVLQEAAGAWLPGGRPRRHLLSGTG